MLSDYNGPANSPSLFQHLVGEKVVACFQVDRKLWLVVESGHAFVCCPNGDVFSFWRENPEEVKRQVQIRRDQIKRLEAELKDMAGVKL